MTRIALILVAALAIALGIGQPVAAESGSEGPPTGVIAFVEKAPPYVGVITAAEFHRSLAQVAAQAGVSPAPKLGDRRYRRFAEQALDDLIEFAWVDGEAGERAERHPAADFEEVRGDQEGKLRVRGGLQEISA